MVHKVCMPRVDANVDEGMVGTWFVDEGDRVEEGDRIVEIITDKATLEVESDDSGYVRSKIAPEKSVLPVGYVLALVAESRDEALPDVSDENQEVMQEYRNQMLFGDEEGEAEQASEPGGETAGAQPAGSTDRVRATPSARRLALKHGVDLQKVALEVNGVIRQEDVEEMVETE